MISIRHDPTAAYPEPEDSYSPSERHLTFIDGIIAGEGNGPLAPRPLSAGVLLFGDNAGRPFLTPIGWRGYFEAHT